MKSQIDAVELTLRIRREAQRLEDLAFPSPDSPEYAHIDDARPMPRAPVLAVTPPSGFSCESLLAQSGNMIESARAKTTVDKAVPKLLRRLSRNQGGYNDIVVEALTRMHEASRQLMIENAQLRLHIRRQTEWMQAADRRLAQIENRIEKVEPQSDPAEQAPEP